MEDERREVDGVHCVDDVEENLAVQPIFWRLLVWKEFAQIRYGHHFLDQ